jgi:hypothetical protein
MTPSVIPPSPGGGRSSREAWRDGVKARASALRIPASRAPHPAHLRCATLPLQGRVKKAISSSQRDPRRSLINGEARNRQTFSAIHHSPLAFFFPLQKRGGRTPTDADPTAALTGAARAQRSAHACRRSTAALAKDMAVLGSAPGQASWDVVLTGVTRAFLSQSSGSTPHTGRNAGEHDARSRPGADCKSARGNRTHSTSRLASGERPLESGILIA